MTDRVCLHPHTIEGGDRPFGRWCTSCGQLARAAKRVGYGRRDDPIGRRIAAAQTRVVAEGVTLFADLSRHNP